MDVCQIMDVVLWYIIRIKICYIYLVLFIFLTVLLLLFSSLEDLHTHTHTHTHTHMCVCVCVCGGGRVFIYLKYILYYINNIYNVLSLKLFQTFIVFFWSFISCHFSVKYTNRILMYFVLSKCFQCKSRIYIDHVCKAKSKKNTLTQCVLQNKEQHTKWQVCFI